MQFQLLCFSYSDETNAAHLHDTIAKLAVITMFYQ